MVLGRSLHGLVRSRTTHHSRPPDRPRQGHPFFICALSSVACRQPLRQFSWYRSLSCSGVVSQIDGMSLKKVVIFGASGQVGLKASEEAIRKGYSVRAFLRDPSRFPEELSSKVEIVKGDVTDKKAVEDAVKDQDAVVVALGTRNDLAPTTVLSQGMKNITESMKAHGVKLVSVCISAFLFYEPEKVPAIFKDLNADHQRMFDILKESDLNWIAVLPPHFTDDESAKYTIKHDASPGRTISKTALGAFLVDSLLQPEHYRKVCGICQEKPPEETSAS